MEMIGETNLVSYLKAHPHDTYKCIATFLGIPVKRVSFAARTFLGWHRKGRPERFCVRVPDPRLRPYIRAHHTDLYPDTGTGCTAFDDCDKCGFPDCRAY